MCCAWFWLFNLPYNSLEELLLGFVYHYGLIDAYSIYYNSLPSSWGFPGSSDSKASAYNVGDPGLIPGLGRSPGEGNGNPLQYSCLENHGLRILVGYSPWGRKELDPTERPHFTIIMLLDVLTVLI